MSTTSTTTASVERVQASTLQVGDVIGTTRGDTQAKVAAGPAGDGAVQEIAAITNGSGRVQARNDAGKIIRSMEPTTEVWRARTSDASAEETVDLAVEMPSAPTGYEWPRDPQAILGEYLAAHVSADQDAPAQLKPFIDGKGQVRVHPTSWVAYLVDAGESDGFGWPQRDGLKWPHLALVDVSVG